MPVRDLIRRTETRALLLWLGMAGAIWGFLKLAGEMTEGETNAFDSKILLALRRPGDLADPIGSRSVEESMRDVTALGGVTFPTPLTVVAPLARLFHGKWKRALVFAGTVIAADISSEVLKQVYDRPWPALVPHGSYVYSAS